MLLPLGKTVGQGRSLPLTGERIVNLYPEVAPEGSIAPYWLVGCPGLVRWATTGRIRGMIKHQDELYAVADDKLIKYASDKSTSTIGTVPGTQRVSMATNGTQLVVVNGTTTGYVYDGTTFQSITDVDFPGADTVTFMDGYFIFTYSSQASTFLKKGEFFISNLRDGLTYDALDFANAEKYPDRLQHAVANLGELWLFGTDTIEVWYNSGDVDFPFERIPQAVVEKGLLNRWTVARADNSIYWVDDDGIVRRAQDGYVPLRISTHAVEYEIGKSVVSETCAFSYVQEGHEFYVLALSNKTLVYDAATQLWHERDTLAADATRWRADTGMDNIRVYDKVLVGSSLGNIYELDLDTFTDDGGDMVADCYMAPLKFEGRPFRVPYVRLDMETGTQGAATDYQVTLRRSRDGQTWKARETQVSSGKQGDYGARVIWRRLGAYRQLYLHFRISDPIKRALYAVYAEIA